MATLRKCDYCPESVVSDDYADHLRVMHPTVLDGEEDNRLVVAETLPGEDIELCVPCAVGRITVLCEHGTMVACSDPLTPLQAASAFVAGVFIEYAKAAQRVSIGFTAGAVLAARFSKPRQ